jgi:rRNA-processing protein FCF1
MISAYLQEIIRKYARIGIIVDTNLLLLWLIGQFNVTLILSFKRTQGFSVANFERLTGFIAQFRKIVVTPHILTEVSNFVGQLGEPVRQKVYQHFAEQLPAFDEIPVAAVDAAVRPEIAMLGLSDVCILMAAQNRYPVLTNDLNLGRYLSSNGIDLVNYNVLSTQFED